MKKKIERTIPSVRLNAFLTFYFFFHVCNLEAIGLPGILLKNYRKPAKVNSHVFPDGLNFLLLV